MTSAALIGGAAIAAGASALSNGFNIWNQNKINSANVEAQKEINKMNLDYMREMTQRQWERDDSAYQRQVADLEAAGLSPLAATGAGAANSQPVGSPNLQAAMQYPSSFHAPQFDINSFLQTYIKSKQVEDQHQELLSKQGYRASVIDQKSISLQLIQDRLNADIDYRNSLLSQQNTHFIQSFELQSQIFEHTKNKDLQDLDIKSFCAKSQAVYNALNSNLPDKNLPHKVFYIKSDKDLDLYETHYNLYMDSFTRYLNSVEHSAQYKANAGNSSRGGSASVSGSGLGFGISVHASEGYYSAESKDKNQLFDESWAAYCMHNNIFYPVPVDMR